jgi:hypothetical protein
MTKVQQLGSMTAKGGFLNESDICKKFLNYQNDSQAQTWLTIMGFDYKKINLLTAIQIPVRINKENALLFGINNNKYEESVKYKKADIQIKIEITIDDLLYIENLSLKKANKNAGFNQVDKRPVLTYQDIWQFDNQIAYWLKCFTGEVLPSKIDTKLVPSFRDKKRKRIFLDEVPEVDRNKIVEFFKENKYLIISDIIKGRGGLSAEWLLVTQKDTEHNNKVAWVLKDINTSINFYAQGEVKITPRGSLRIGRITMQRKGGTPDPTSLQFKMNPLELFNA